MKQLLLPIIATVTFAAPHLFVSLTTTVAELLVVLVQMTVGAGEVVPAIKSLINRNVYLICSLHLLVNVSSLALLLIVVRPFRLLQL